MDKSKLKKIALMGMAGGMLVAAQTPVVANTATGAETVLAGSGCGAGCGSKKNHSCGAHQNNCGAKINQGSCGSKRNQGCGAQNPNRPRYGNPTAYNDDEDTSRGTVTQSGKTLSESELLTQLNSDGKATYQSLSPEGKALALRLAGGSCKGMNDCKGLSACKSGANSCAGKNGCRSQGTGFFKDKNAAVKVAAQHMAEKRSGMSSSDSQFR